jgi:hypothetical protein
MAALDAAEPQNHHPYSKSHARRLRRKEKSALYGGNFGTEVEAALDDMVADDPELQRELELGRDRDARAKKVERRQQAATAVKKIGADSSKKRITEAERKRTLSVIRLLRPNLCRLCPPP